MWIQIALKKLLVLPNINITFFYSAQTKAKWLFYVKKNIYASVLVKEDQEKETHQLCPKKIGLMQLAVNALLEWLFLTFLVF